jgi:hypothetical protein
VRRHLALALAALSLSGACARCAPAAARDAGRAEAVAPPPRARHSVDLRSALLVAFPEYRGATILDGRAALTRRYSALPAEAWAKAVTGNGFTEFDGGLFRKPFLLERPEPEVAVLSLPVDGELVQKVFEAPTPMSSMDMGLYLPRGLPVEAEAFELALHYGAMPHRRAGFLARQVVELLLRNGQWATGATPEGWGANPDDGGYGEVPEHFTVTLRELSRPATLTVKRDAGEVRVTYRLVTDAPAP